MKRLKSKRGNWDPRIVPPRRRAQVTTDGGVWTGQPKWILLNPDEEVLWLDGISVAVRMRRGTFRRNLRCWLLRLAREWLRPGPMYGALKGAR